MTTENDNDALLKKSVSRKPSLPASNDEMIENIITEKKENDSINDKWWHSWLSKSFSSHWAEIYDRILEGPLFQLAAEKDKQLETERKSKHYFIEQAEKLEKERDKLEAENEKLRGQLSCEVCSKEVPLEDFMMCEDCYIKDKEKAVAAEREKVLIDILQWLHDEFGINPKRLSNIDLVQNYIESEIQKIRSSSKEPKA